MKRNNYSLFLFIPLFLVSIVACIVPEVAFAEEAQKILLVYDSLNGPEVNENNVDSIQRLLASYRTEATTLSIDDYTGSELIENHYDGVITMVNWPAKGVGNSKFISDRKQFSGKKLHIGPNVLADEKQLFSGQWKELSHRQFTLKDEHGIYSQILEYKNKSTLLVQTDGQALGRLSTQELESQEYPFGVIENQHAFLPFYSVKGATFLKSSELIGEWLGIDLSLNPVLSIQGMNPMKEMNVAQELQKELYNLSIPYVISSTSVNENNTTLPFQIFTDVLASFQKSGVVALEVPKVNNVNLNDDHELARLMEQQISLLVDRNVFPIGISAPGYWNQDKQYQADGLSFSNTLILTENPPKEEILYREQSNTSKVFETVFYDLPFVYLDGVQWQLEGTVSDFSFLMPTTLSFDFPDTSKEVKKIMSEITGSPVRFYSAGKVNYRLELQTQTQHIEYKNHRLYLNGQLINGLSNIKETTIPKNKYKGQLSEFFSVTNFVLVSIVSVTLTILGILFFFGRKNYRSKYLNTKEEKK